MFETAINSVVAVLVTIVTQHVGSLGILRRLAYTTGNGFGHSYDLVA
jgi:hypothetical protein